MAGTELANSQSEPLPVTEIIALVAVARYPKFIPSKRSVLSSLVSRTWNTTCRSHILLDTAVLVFRFTFSWLCFLHFEVPHLCEYIQKVNTKFTSGVRLLAALQSGFQSF
ncbi:hypothetical protein BDN71DRAFT_1441033 [Pleurotus eryngii]|uniref:Uncharacterized protein n=1 Tax=Pleurotus eryngii TaxID=5323 RepID=A0A9P6A5J3_PLEER|nr:hypothetical protein BDN71DRAFT_1441033 [Pleurotus eryngii]